MLGTPCTYGPLFGTLQDLVALGEDEKEEDEEQEKGENYSEQACNLRST